MKINIKKHLLALLAVPALALSVSAAPVFAAEDLTLRGGVDSSKSADQPASLFGDGGIFETVSKVLLFVIGAVSVIMLIIGGFRYVTSNGDSSQVTAAKNTIMYSVIGLIIAIFAYGIVNFVVFRVGGIAITQEQQEQQKAQQGS